MRDRAAGAAAAPQHREEDCVLPSHRFGRVEIRPIERQVWIDGALVPLGSRAFDVLMALLEHRQRVVSKDELLDLAWPGLVVEENNLAVQVSALRKVLGPQTIVTVPGRGYRFAAALAADDLVEAPAASSDAPRGPVAPLPAPATPLLGRDDELATLSAWLASHRLVTLLGAGGIGKTSLALAAARARLAAQHETVAWVDLAALTDAALVPTAVAQALGLPVTAADDPGPPLVAALASMQALLVLDNAEHVLLAVTRLARAVLAGAPEVRLLVTSQAALKLDAEHVFRVGPLSVPEAGATSAQALGHGAVALFVEQAGSADRRFALDAHNVDQVVTLCRRLDGVALALKLAAARLPLLGLDGLVARLDERLTLLARRSEDTPARQQTLQAALDWSHGLLGPVEQAVFRRLGVFAGGFALETAVQVAGEGFEEWQVMDALGELVDRSFVVLASPTAARYRLPESAREHALVQLERAGEQVALQRCHAQAIADRLDTAYERCWRQSDRAWLDEYGPDLDNLRVALDWATSHDSVLAVRLAGAAGLLMLLLGLAPEARRRMALLAPSAETARDRMAARYWLERSRLHWGVSSARMHEFAMHAATLCRAAGDRRGLAMALRAAIGSEVPSSEASAAMLDEMAMLEQPDWPPRLRAQRLLGESTVLRRAGRTAEARVVLDALLVLATAAGLDAMRSSALAGLAGVQLLLGDAQAALHSARTLIDDPASRHSNLVLHALGTVVDVLLGRDDLGAARQAVADFIAAARSRDWEWFGLYADRFAWLAAAQGRTDAAACLLGHADAAWSAVGERDPIARRAHRRAASLVDVQLDEVTRQRLIAEGARMDAASVCQLVLPDADDR
jgi:predicted ATPase/DNA-binding winged helix-turn-helix (wHTH) protein